MAYGEKKSVTQQSQPALSATESAALAIDEATLYALPSALRSRLAVQWATTQRPGHRALAHSMIKLCDLISIESHYRGENDDTPMPYVFSEQITNAFFDSPHEGSMDLFFETAREQSLARLADAPNTELDPATNLPKTLMRQDLGPRLTTILARGDTANAWNLIARPFPLALPFPSTLDFGDRARLWDGEPLQMQFRASPVAVCLAKGGLFEIGRALIERPEVWSLARSVFTGAQGTLDKTPDAHRHHSRGAQERAPDDFNFLKKDPSIFAQAWPLIHSMMEKLTPAGIERFRPEWVSHFVLSSSPEARQWSRDHFSADVFRFVFEDKLRNSAENITAFFRCGDTALWNHAIATIGVPALLRSSSDRGTLMMMRAASNLDAPQFREFATRVARSNPAALLAHLREGCWVIESDGMRKKGDFLAYCVAANKPEHATIAKDLFADNSLSMNYARDLIKYCKAKDPVNYGPKTVATWERLLLDDVLSRAKKDQAAQVAQKAASAPIVAAGDNLPLFTDAAAPARAPRRSNRL